MNRFNQGHVEGRLVTSPVIKKGGLAHFVELYVRAHNDSTDTSYSSRMREDRFAAVTLYVHNSRFDRSDYENMEEGAEVSCDYWVDSHEYKGRWYTKLRTNEVTVEGNTYPKPIKVAKKEKKPSRSPWSADGYWDDPCPSGVDYDSIPDDELRDMARDDLDAWCAGADRGLW